MEKAEDPMSKHPGKSLGKGFQTVDSLAYSFPTIDIESFRKGIEATLREGAKRGYTGIEEELEFDEHDLLVGKYLPNSLAFQFRVRTRGDFEVLLSKLSEGRNFDSSFTFDPKISQSKNNLHIEKARADAQSLHLIQPRGLTETETSAERARRSKIHRFNLRSLIFAEWVLPSY